MKKGYCTHVQWVYSCTVGVLLYSGYCTHVQFMHQTFSAKNRVLCPMLLLQHISPIANKT